MWICNGHVSRLENFGIYVQDTIYLKPEYGVYIRIQFLFFGEK